MYLKVKDISTRTGVHPETIRFYEKKGLLPPPLRAANSYRLYGQEAVFALQFIKKCRQLDFSLEEIHAMLNWQKTPHADCSGVDALITNQLAKVQQQIERLQAIEHFLQDLVGCNAHEVQQCKGMEGIDALPESLSISQPSP